MEEFTRESIIALLKELNTLLEEHGLSPNWLSDGVTDLGFDFSADADPRTIEAQIQQRVGRYYRVDGRTEFFVKDIAAEL
ncbi:MAG: hypothetical protein E7Z94_06300 [Actinomyces ruminicola]|nr:hypothetical protein [Actinomyces ruminicola]